MNDSYKRPFDLLVLFATHILLSPILVLLWIIIPIAIWLEDRGPIFYTQERVGKNGKIFRLYKFRSMVVDAEKHVPMYYFFSYPPSEIKGNKDEWVDRYCVDINKN